MARVPPCVSYIGLAKTSGRVHNIAAAGAVDREFGDISVFYFEPETGSRKAGRGFKRFLEAVGFILAEFELKRNHGDPISMDLGHASWRSYVCERDICV